VVCIEKALVMCLQNRVGILYRVIIAKAYIRGAASERRIAPRSFFGAWRMGRYSGNSACRFDRLSTKGQGSTA